MQMIKKYQKELRIILRIILFWAITMLTSAITISIFSAFLPLEKYYNFIEFYQFNYRDLAYFRLTILFYLFVGGIVALPGFICNLAIYFSGFKGAGYKTKKIISIAINLTIAGIVLFFYFRLNISRTTDLITIIAPIYLLAILFWGWIILPGNSILKNPTKLRYT